MNSIKMMKDGDGQIYLNQSDLLEIFNERLSRFPQEIEELKQPKRSLVVGLDGAQKIIPPDQNEISKKEGMKLMLEGIIDILNIQE